MSQATELDLARGRLSLALLGRRIYGDAWEGSADQLAFIGRAAVQSYEPFPEDVRPTDGTDGKGSPRTYARFGPRPQPRLGLDSLTDDQLLDLLAAAYEEVGSRLQDRWWLWLDHKQRIEEDYKRRAQAAMESLEHGRQKQIQAQREQIGLLIEQRVREGKLKLLEPEDEAKLVEAITEETQIRLIDEFYAALESGTTPEFTLTVSNGRATLVFGRWNSKVEKIVIPRAATEMGDAIRKAMC